MGNICNKKRFRQQIQNTTTGQQIVTNQHSPNNMVYNREYYNKNGFNDIHSSYHIANNNIYSKNYGYNNANIIHPSNKGSRTIAKEVARNKLSQSCSQALNFSEQQKLSETKGEINRSQNNGIIQLNNDIIKNGKSNLMTGAQNLQREPNINEGVIMQKNNEIKQYKTVVNEKENEKAKLKNDKDNLLIENKNLNQRINELQNQLNSNESIILQKNNEIEQLKKMELVSKNKENEIIANYNNLIKQNKIQYENSNLNYVNEIKKYNEEKMLIQKQNENLISNYEIEKNNLKNELERIKLENLALKLNKEPILVGLNNIGATCYMNATLQCLSSTTKLSEYFLKMFKYEPNNKNRIMSNEYYIVVKNLWDINNNNKSFSPDSFKEKLSQENPLFEGIQANDSKDLINFLLERFHLELNEPRNDQNNNMMNNYVVNQNDQLYEDKMLRIFINEFTMKYNSIISNLFYGMFETLSQCQKCKNIKYNFQIYSFLEFPLEQVNKYCFNHGKRQNYNYNNQNPDVDLYECFEYNCNFDLMTGDNQMYCNICNSTQDALYGTKIYSTPNYLIINLNRGRGAVYECKVIFPEKLNLLNFVTFKNGNTVFELYAVICHLGPSSMSGHFVAYCKKKKDDHYKWYLFNDAIVSECKNKEEYRNGMPYILFYKAI